MKPRITDAKPAFISIPGRPGRTTRSMSTRARLPVPEPLAPCSSWTGLPFRRGCPGGRSLRKAGRIPRLRSSGGYGASFGEPGICGTRLHPTASADEPNSGMRTGSSTISRRPLAGTRAAPAAARDGRMLAGHSLGRCSCSTPLQPSRSSTSPSRAPRPSGGMTAASWARLKAADGRPRSREPLHRRRRGRYASMTADLAFSKATQRRPFRDLRLVCERFTGRNHYDVVHTP